MKAAVIAFTRRGAALGGRLASFLGTTCHVPGRLSREMGCPAYESLPQWTANAWRKSDALIFVGAAGIAVRAVAPHVKDKFCDPAVISIDEAGKFVIPLLSGHVGGANALALTLAEFLGAVAAISTATDINGLFAVDVWASQRGLRLSDRALAKQVSAELLEGKSFSIISDFPLSGAPEDTGEIKLYLTCKSEPGDALRIIPRAVTLGIGCRRETKAADIETAVLAALSESGIDMRAVREVCSIDLKKDEPGLIAFCKRYALPFKTYSAEQLMSAEGDFASSNFVKATTGADNVCERAAVLYGGRLIIRKKAAGGVTVAAAMAEPSFEF